MSQDNLVGRTVAGYKLLSHVGEGGTATVYRAEHPERGPAAIKILRPRMAQDPIAVKRFLREAEFGARVRHDNIIRTYDFGESEGLYYLALEWAKGEPLASFLTAAGRLAPPVVANIIEQLGHALGVAHRAGSFTVISSRPISCTIQKLKPRACSILASPAMPRTILRSG